jgi:hypothetical protein
MWPTWRAVSSRRWNTTQRSVVGRISPDEVRSREPAPSKTTSAASVSLVEGDDVVDRPSLGHVEHSLSPRHVHGLAGEDDPHPQPFGVAQVDHDGAQ